MPWKQYSGGNITITQQFLLTLKQSSTFTFFFYVISYRKYIEFPFAIFTRFAPIIPQPKHIIYDGDVGLYLTGSSPLQILNVSITLLKGSSTEGFVLYDGPSQLCPPILSYAGEPDRTNQNNSKQNTNWEKATSSFQALLVIDVMKMLLVRTYVVTWWATDAKTTRLDFEYYSSNLGSSKNGLILLHTISNQPTYLIHTGIISFEYFGPDTFSSSLGLEFCQYGGLWIFGSNDKDFPAKTKLFQHCSSDNITHMELYIPWEYTVIAVVQYN